MTERVLAIVARAIRHRTPAPQVTRDSTFKALGVDAIDAWSISCEIEEALEIELDDAEIEAWRSVADVIASAQREAV